MQKSFDQRVAEAKATIASVSAVEARDLAQAGRVVFVDPRPAAAIASTTGLIPGAANVDLKDIARGALPVELDDPDTRVITACQAGCMGAVAAHELANRGFRHVAYLAGGTQAWLDAGFPTTH